MTTQTGTSESTQPTSGWIVYSGIMLLILGIKLVIDGLWALDRSDTVVDDLFYTTDLSTWGWIWLISGAVIFAAGIAIFSRAQWARWVGVFAASYGLVVSLTWLFAAPIAALIGVLLASLILYGLIVYGDDFDY